ncbi:MAG: ABC transporter ATP-binding protein [Actinobacteria bacterium]|nr:ABC transporter ATP-binding protein [Actinomycetota bacterium]
MPEGHAATTGGAPGTAGANGVLLKVRGLQTHFLLREGVVRAVDGVDFELARGRTLGLVGESGCGKSVTAASIMRLIRAPGRIVGGEVIWRGRDLLRLSEEQMRSIRGNEIAISFQEPMTALNPVFSVGNQIMEVMRRHRRLNKHDQRERTIQVLRTVGIPEPERRLKAYPHELSGGMRQRVMLAMAVACEPQLLLADEPTTALDVTIQSQILELIRDLRARTGMSVLLITHDLGVVAETADDVGVMYAGELVELTDAATLFTTPKHPYTQLLLASIPTLKTDRRRRLTPITGTVPHMMHLPRGCLFEPRCPFAMDICRKVRPPMQLLRTGQAVRCHLYPTAADERAPSRPAATTHA